MTFSSRRICQVLTLCVLLIAVAAVLVEGLTPESGTDLPIYYGTMALAAAGFFTLIFGIIFTLLRLGTRDGTTYWSTPRATAQIPKIALLVGVIFCVQTAADTVLARFGFGTSLMAGATGMLAWTIIPAAFMHFGFIRWPTRLHYASRRTLALGATIGLITAAAWSATAFNLSATSNAIPTPDSLLVIASALIVAAAGEEIVFRALLLTALVEVTESRLHAVLISSVAFAAMHAPYQFSVPILYGDWHMLLPISQDYAGKFVSQVAVGLGLGVLWLRTGSIAVVTLSHAVLNFGNTLANGY